MNPFRFARATSVHAALAIPASIGAAYLAGGTTLIDLMKEGVECPGAILDIGSLPLTEVSMSADGAVRVGAMVSNADLARHPLVLGRYRLLADAILSGASAQIRNMATTGGNLLQRTRCPYFRDLALPCNKRQPGTGCGALDGFNRSNAVLGGSEHCIATHPSDMAVALVALDAVVYVASAKGERRIPIREFYRLPGDTPQRETALVKGDLIAGVVLPLSSASLWPAYVKVRDRASFEFALASAAVVMGMEQGTISKCGIALGGIGTVPWHAKSAERILLGRTPDDRVFDQAADAALAGATPRKHNAFKVELAKNTLIRALQQAARQS